LKMEEIGDNVPVLLERWRSKSRVAWSNQRLDHHRCVGTMRPPRVLLPQSQNRISIQFQQLSLRTLQTFRAYIRGCQTVITQVHNNSPISAFNWTIQLFFTSPPCGFPLRL
jgi:hypothetical protein